MRGNYFRSNSSWVILKSLGRVSLANHIKRLKTRKGAPRKNSRKNNVADDKPRYLFLVNRIQSWPIASDWGREFTHLRVSSTGLSETKSREKREIPLHEDGICTTDWVFGHHIGGATSTLSNIYSVTSGLLYLPLRASIRISTHMHKWLFQLVTAWGVNLRRRATWCLER